MKTLSLSEELSSTSYPGRGIILGKSACGKYAIAAYFIMGRSENSRNRIFVQDGEGIKTQAFDPSKMSDPSLIIYSPVRVLNDFTIVTNGDQTDTVYEEMSKGKSFEESLRGREFEPDAPNFTPRISGIMKIKDGAYNFALSILKSDNGNKESCNRFTYKYSNPQNGLARFIHTYMSDGNPLPSFEGEPALLQASASNIDEWTNQIWSALNQDNKVSLWTRWIEISSGKVDSRIVNKNK
ncbi:MAG: IMP cyclohydrolase [Treponema sp.]|nr:IMP cyclohydrolase [Treponema sp.]